MLNQLKFLGFAASLAIAAPAMAQSPNGVLETVGANDVSAMLADFGIASEVKNAAPGQAPAILATTEGGAKFLIGFFDCAQPTAAAGCKQAMVSTAQSSAGIAFDELNSFNGNANVTTVVYDSSNQILIFGRNIFMTGGIGRDNFKAQVYLFLADMQEFMNGRRASAKSVSLKVQPELNSKISSITVGDHSPMATRIGISQDASVEIGMAISNSLDVNFTNGSTPQ
jgi:hypothetical protein